MTLTIGSLFSGIGGLELGLEWSGLGPVRWQCEIDPFCRAVLAKHWPDVERFEDVTSRTNWPSVDIVCGGFPCQDVSAAGLGRGIGGVRSGLWYHFARVVSEVRPRFVVVENVASGARRWLPTVRHGLHVLGYRTRAVGVSAADVGAPHLRRRVFVVAYPDRQSLAVGVLESPPEERAAAQRGRRSPRAVSARADTDGQRELQPGWREPEERRRSGDRRDDVGDAVMTWATPCASDDHGPKGTASNGGRNLPREAGGHLNPTWVAWLMGFPEGWLDGIDVLGSVPSATRSSRSARGSSGK